MTKPGRPELSLTETKIQCPGHAYRYDSLGRDRQYRPEQSPTRVMAAATANSKNFADFN